MSVTFEDLKTFLGAGDYESDALIEGCFDEAVALVDKYVGQVLDVDGVTYVPRPVPAPILDRAYLEVGADLFHRRSAPNGIASQQFATADGIGTSVRIQRDPMAAAYKILGRWVLPW